jgi:hypothetical protein
MRHLALVLALSPFLILTAANSIQPAAAGDYYERDGYYGGYGRNYYRSEPYHRPYYGPTYSYRSSYSEPSRRYYSDDSCRRRVRVIDYQGEQRWGWVSGC